ncbi:MAG: hypothetical protein A2847_02995 [Candidatus Sungbacteria bacterium RIFCSPHIGHO2_01_FULL_50_25]|uniref:Uncharacterized protein n=1 Tax=Candidatus Sungbacteria bacterium RIFCSPHIGHO2_01_FULL_50_25 TaxID=1802265 RepID=A0A1G2K959_9BACT|nr:MAG: hypothetical protein A2847_02995 [Candidatus Sungbacteria bacterium RIFCSPHIGHO2_01_FULL_50_25]
MDQKFRSQTKLWLALAAFVFAAGVLVGYGLRTPITAFLDLLDGEAIEARKDLAVVEKEVRKRVVVPDPNRIQRP